MRRRLEDKTRIEGEERSRRVEDEKIVSRERRRRKEEKR